MSSKSASVVNKSSGTVSTRQKCQHRALAKVIKNETNHDVFDCDLVSSSSALYLPIKQEFFKRAHELKNARIASFIDVETLIKKYDSLLRRHRLDILKRLHDRDRQKFMKSIKVIQSVASKYLCCMPQKLPLLVQGMESEVSLSQQQISCILANIFFFNEPYKIDKKYENDYPYLNFRRLFISERQSSDSLKCEKLKFIFSYFNQLNNPISNGVVTFRRQGIRKEGIDWTNSNENMTQVEFSNGKIEEGVSKGYNEVHFANEMIGGGVLGQSAVQGEIRFLMSPELIVSRLFTQKLSPTEAVVITGAQIFSIGEGYSKDFRFKQKYSDRSQPDDFNRKPSHIIAIDALCFDAKDKTRQFHGKYIDRELNKAFAGFKGTSNSSDTIASGKWGCGNFNGDPHLKCFIQMLAAAEAKQNLVIYTFGDEKLCGEMKSIYVQLREKNVTVGKLYKVLLDYTKQSNGTNIYQFIQSIINNIEKIQKSKNNSAYGKSNVQLLAGLRIGDMQPVNNPKANLSFSEFESTLGRIFGLIESRDRSKYEIPVRTGTIYDTSISGYKSEDHFRDQSGYQNPSGTMKTDYPNISRQEYKNQREIQEESGYQYPRRNVYPDISGRYINEERVQERNGFQNTNRNLNLPNIIDRGYQNDERILNERMYQNRRSVYSNAENGIYGRKDPAHGKSYDQNPSGMKYTGIDWLMHDNQKRVLEKDEFENSSRSLYPGLRSEGRQNEKRERYENRYQNERSSYSRAETDIRKNLVQGKSSYKNPSNMEYAGIFSRGYVNQKRSKGTSGYQNHNQNRNVYTDAEIIGNLNEERVRDESRYQNQNKSSGPNATNVVYEHRNPVQNTSDYENPSRRDDLDTLLVDIDENSDLVQNKGERNNLS